jgi:hypothetical protein
MMVAHQTDRAAVAAQRSAAAVAAVSKSRRMPLSDWVAMPRTAAAAAMGSILRRRSSILVLLLGGRSRMRQAAEEAPYVAGRCEGRGTNLNLHPM